MASIRQRGKKYIVRYRGFKDGVYKSIEESFNDESAAYQRKVEIEENSKSLCRLPSKTIGKKLTIENLINDYVTMYGKYHWNPDTYKDKIGRINNYILPYIGKLYASDATPQVMDEYYARLSETPATPCFGHKKKQETLISPRIILECHTILNGAFKLAVKYRKISENPVANPILPQLPKSEQRKIWDMKTFKQAITDDDLDITMFNIMNLGVSATSRIGEITGLLWRNVHIDESLIEKDQAYIEIVTELNRFDRKIMEIAKNRKISFTFPNIVDDSKTVLVLTEPKNRSSYRKVYLPKTVAISLKKEKERQEKIQIFKGSEYQDFGLVFTQENGRPIESNLFNKKLKKFCNKHNLPMITSHSFRHLGATLKLEISNGDIKTVQADTGHARSSTLVDIYAHTFKEKRIKNTKKLDSLLYDNNDIDENTELLDTILSSPDLLEKVKKALEKQT